jgi:hypothetical protein
MLSGNGNIFIPSLRDWRVFERPPPVNTGGYKYFIPAGLPLSLTVSGDFGKFFLRWL